MRATRTSSRSSTRLRRITPVHTSCATAPDAAITRPATTARIVANATALMIARKRSPPSVPSPPPSSSASSGVIEVAAGGVVRGQVAEDRARADPDEHGHDEEGADQQHAPRDRAARRLGVGHGEEAHQQVRQPGGAEQQREPERDRVDRVRVLQAGGQVAVLLGMRRGGALEQLERVEARTSTARGSQSTVPAVISSPALMICTHVVASMPPKIT